MSNLNIPAIDHSHSNLQNIDPILATVNSYDKHPGIEIKNRSCNSTFSFRKDNPNKVNKIIDSLNIKKKNCQNSDIRTKIIKPNKHIIAALISENFNSCIDNGGICQWSKTCGYCSSA